MTNGGFEYKLLSREKEDHLRQYGKTACYHGETDRNTYYLCDKTGLGLTAGHTGYKFSYYLLLEEAIDDMKKLCLTKIEALEKLRLGGKENK